MITPQIPKGTSQHRGLMTYKLVWLLHICSITIFFSTASDGTLRGIFHLQQLCPERPSMWLFNRKRIKHKLSSPFSRYFCSSSWIHPWITTNLFPVYHCSSSNTTQIPSQILRLQVTHGEATPPLRTICISFIHCKNLCNVSSIKLTKYILKELP